MSAAPRAAVLPVGLRDTHGRLWRSGTMRAATVRDEVEALRDFRVFLDPACLLLVLLARVLRFEGRERPPSAHELEALVVTDAAYLEDIYRELNGYASVALLDGETGEAP